MSLNRLADPGSAEILNRLQHISIFLDILSIVLFLLFKFVIYSAGSMDRETNSNKEPESNMQYALKAFSLFHNSHSFFVHKFGREANVPLSRLYVLTVNSLLSLTFKEKTSNSNNEGKGK